MLSDITMYCFTVWAFLFAFSENFDSIKNLFSKSITYAGHPSSCRFVVENDQRYVRYISMRQIAT